MQLKENCLDLPLSFLWELCEMFFQLTNLVQLIESTKSFLFSKLTSCKVYKTNSLMLLCLRPFLWHTHLVLNFSNIDIFLKHVIQAKCTNVSKLEQCVQICPVQNFSDIFFLKLSLQLSTSFGNFKIRIIVLDMKGILYSRCWKLNALFMQWNFT